MATKTKSKAVVKVKREAPPEEEKVVTSIDEPADFSTSSGTLFSKDVADIPKASNKDEHVLLTGESWVILGEAEGVPEWAVGSPAAVIDSPVSRKRNSNGDLLYEYTHPDASITVRERSQGVTFSVPLSSCQKVSLVGGRSSLVNFP